MVSVRRPLLLKEEFQPWVTCSQAFLVWIHSVPGLTSGLHVFFFFLTQCSGEPGGTAAGQGWQQGDYSALLAQALAPVPRAFWEPMQRPGKEAGLNRPL